MIFEIILPCIQDIATEIVTAVLVLVAKMLIDLRKHILKWLATRNDVREIQPLHRIAESTFAYVESKFKGSDSQIKIFEAVRHMENSLMIEVSI